MKLLTEVENEIPVGNRELPMGEMKTKDVANPNKGKWRVVNADTNKPFDASKFYDTKEDAQAAARELGQTKGSGVKIMQLKDTMKVYTKEGEMPLGRAAGVTDEHQAILKAIQDMVMSGDHKILDLIKDKMEAEWGDELESGRSGPWSRNYNDTDDIENMNMEEGFLSGIRKAVTGMSKEESVRWKALGSLIAKGGNVAHHAKRYQEDYGKALGLTQGVRGIYGGGGDKEELEQAIDSFLSKNGMSISESLYEAPEWKVGKSYQDGIAKKVVKMGADKVRVTFDTGDTITYQIAKDNPENWVQIS